ncbi:hypothetical protein VT84_13020 [Gemmata sp. SH-PL17]|uniref:hypothetical protein n=1 Tax=Gemmata sp. SH-PL17 TaxID=1630693 RepID=UPI0004B73C73|nr:hypothetical protein [Gemmata sp. SH-PL17]AMV25315.1 hypothetical protein VT84_13020 [Gemmata sp. SH-PL17]
MKTHRIIAAALGLFVLAGCNGNSPKTYSVSGKVALVGGDTQKLAGHHIEVALATDPTVRAAGVIGPDGTFSLETLHAGVVLKGAKEGQYQVRILPADEDDNGTKLKKPPIAARHFKFESSGLSLKVPATGDVNLELSPR